MKSSVNKLPKWLVVGVGFPLSVLNGWILIQLWHFFQPQISIFLAAILLSFVLDYPVRFLQRRGVKRENALWLVFLIGSVMLTTLGLIFVPIFLKQLNEFANRLPSWIESGSRQLLILNQWALTRNLPIDLSGLAGQVTARLTEQIQTLTGTVLSFAIDTIGSILNVFLTAVLAFYLVLHGERLWDGLFQWFPSRLGVQVRRSLYQNFHNYFIGQATLAAASGLAITLAFSILNVPLALLFGFALGFMAFFPLVTGVGIVLVSLLLALQDFWLGVKVLIVAFTIDWVNSNIVAPRVLGGFTGLNPVWILVALLLGFKLGGVLGLLIAVPLASFIKNTADSLRGRDIELKG